MRDFVRLPARLHSDSPYYVHPMWFDERTAYRGKNNPILKNSEFVLYILYSDSED